MSEAAEFTVDNGAATPVAITFKPETVAGGTAVFRDESEASFVLMPRLKVRTTLSNATRPTNRTEVTLTYPVKKTVDGVDVVDYTNRADFSVAFHERTPLSVRQDMIALITNAVLNDGPIKDAVVKVSPVWG